MYKGYSFNLHKENDKDLIEWLGNKKVTQTIKDALRKQMNTITNENIGSTNIVNNNIDFISVMKHLIEETNKNENSITNNKETKDIEINHWQSKNEDVVLSSEDEEDFEKIFNM